jgi:hypothetical protein
MGGVKEPACTGSGRPVVGRLIGHEDVTGNVIIRTGQSGVWKDDGRLEF